MLALDLAELASVAAFAERIDGPVDLLIANAGVSKTPDSHLPNKLPAIRANPDCWTAIRLD